MDRERRSLARDEPQGPPALRGRQAEKLDDAKSHLDFLDAISDQCPHSPPTCRTSGSSSSTISKSGFDDKPLKVFSRWLGEGGQYDKLRREAFSAFLKSIGDYYLAPPSRGKEDLNPSRALNRYTSAWVLEPENTEALLFAVMVLHDYTDRVGFDRRVYQELLGRLYRRVGGEYATPVVKVRDRTNVIRAHILLQDLEETALSPNSQRRLG